MHKAIGLDTFDFIIVGAGSAGCVLAERLSQGQGGTVLLLEAGGSDRRFWITTPIGYGKTFDDPQVNWKFRSEPDPATGGRRAYYPRGKVLGGSSSINAMVYCRGLPADYDDWGAAGNPGWNAQSAWSAFDRIERRKAGDGTISGSGALWVEARAQDHHPITRDFIAAATQAGYRAIDDLNQAPCEGVAPYAINTRNGRRWSSASAFLRPAMRRANCVLRCGALTDCVLVRDGRAVGVRYYRGGRVHDVIARREVILCAGAVGSPAILMRSGIGPAGVLGEAGVPVQVANAAVGAQLQDHLGIDYHYKANRPTLNDQLGTRRGQIRAGLRYLFNRSGPLGLSMNQIGGLVRSAHGLERPDIQLYFNPISYSRAQAGKKVLTRPDPWPGFIIGFNACRPTSRGQITIISRDPAQPPRIVPNYLATEQDRADVIAGARVVGAIARTPAIAAITLAPNGFVPHGADDGAVLDDFRERSGTVHHLCGTCRMAPRDRGGVVDAALRVYGIDALRVVDAAIFPNITSANTHAPTVMTAWRAADIILSAR
jgi:choline dehydrogenase